MRKRDRETRKKNALFVCIKHTHYHAEVLLKASGIFFRYRNIKIHVYST